MHRNVTEDCASCGPCQRWTPFRVPRTAQPVDLWAEQRIAMHIVVDVLHIVEDDRGFKRIFVAMDVTSRFKWAMPLLSDTEEDIVMKDAADSAVVDTPVVDGEGE
jgi:hypothetical protein